MKSSLIICLSFILIYLVILGVFGILIFKAKKSFTASGNGSAREGNVSASGDGFPEVKQASGAFWGVFAASLILILLPLLIPLDTYLIVVVCACGDMGLFISLRDRLMEIKGNKNASSE